ncbi:MAG TPA: glyceraldehyde 3-phosphate dehydrogenase NAD-binding domain-containing protein, partial [Bacillota bacterium]|nr:glyceraldehyde 3-phosphate dehydrogenase NAD-binding domain-containing protein [Bacillota bacterium]
MLNVGINGFGRIGRLVFRNAVGRENFKITAINDLVDSATLAHMLKYDSNYGQMEGEIKAGQDHLLINGEMVKVFSEKDPAKIPWKESGVDLVIESTGRFRKRETASLHMQAGAQRVVITAPGEADVVIVMGVNEHLYDPSKHFLVSNASCTTNALAPVVKVLHDHFTVKKGLMNTTHAYTNDQAL